MKKMNLLIFLLMARATFSLDSLNYDYPFKDQETGSDWQPRFKHNPACTGRTQLYGIKVNDDFGALGHNENYDARAWMSVYLRNMGILDNPNRDFSWKKWDGGAWIRSFYSLNNGYTNIHESYVIDDLFNTIMTKENIECFIGLSINIDESALCRDVTRDFLDWQKKAEKQYTRVLARLAVGNCSSTIAETAAPSQGIQCYHDIVVGNRYVTTFKFNKPKLGLYRLNDWENQPRSVFLSMPDVFDDNCVLNWCKIRDHFAPNVISKNGDTFGNNLWYFNIPPQEMFENGGLSPKAIGSKLEKFAKYFKGGDWFQGGVPDLRLLGLGDTGNKVYHWRHVEVYFPEYSAEENSKLYGEDYYGYTGCTGGNGVRVVDDFSMIKFNIQSNSSFFLESQNVTSDDYAEDNGICDFTCVNPGYRSNNDLIKRMMIDKNLNGFVKLARFNDKTMVGFTSVPSHFIKGSPLSTHDPYNPNDVRFTWNMVESIQETLNPQEYFWPSSKMYVPIMGVKRNTIYAAKRIVCDVTASLFVKQNKVFFYKPKDVFLKEFKYRITFGYSSSFEYPQYATRCDDLINTNTPAKFQLPYTTFSPMAVGFSQEYPLRDFENLDQEFFKKCTWDYQHLSMYIEGECSETLMGQQCNNTGNEALFPIFNPNSTRGFDCYHPKKYQPKEGECENIFSKYDLCSFKGKFRNYTYQTQKYPYYNCPMDLNNPAICNNHGILKLEWRCLGEKDQLCDCDPGFHGQFCQLLDGVWNITSLSDEFEMNLLDTETNYPSYNFSDNKLSTETLDNLLLEDCRDIGTNVSFRVSDNQTWKILIDSVVTDDYDKTRDVRVVLTLFDQGTLSCPLEGIHVLYVANVELFLPIVLPTITTTTVPERTFEVFTTTTFQTTTTTAPNTTTQAPTSTTESTTTTSTLLTPLQTQAEKTPECSTVAIPVILSICGVLGSIFTYFVWKRGGETDALLAFFIFLLLGILGSFYTVRLCGIRRDSFLETISKKTLWVKANNLQHDSMKCGKHLVLINIKEGIYEPQTNFEYPRAPFQGKGLERYPFDIKRTHRKSEFNAIPFMGTESEVIREGVCSYSHILSPGGLPGAVPFKNPKTKTTDNYCRETLKENWVGFYCATNNSVFVNHCINVNQLGDKVITDPR
jgi:hypothetical protein